MLELTELIGHIFVVTMISYFVGREGEGGSALPTPAKLAEV